MTVAIVIITILGFIALINGLVYLYKRKTIKNYYDEGILNGIAFWVIGVIWLVAFLSITSFALSEQVVSGIVYNNKNNEALTGNTTFSIRASEDTYVSEENRSSYCLPPNSPYVELVNKAAQDKSTKVVVTTKKYFAFKAPWTCYPNVIVKEL